MDSDVHDLREVTLSSETVFSGRVVRLRVDTVRLPSGRTSTREVVVHPGAVAIVPLTDDARVVLVRQYRQAAGQVLLEIPAGTLEDGEAPESCAHRELAEEVGLVAARLEPLASFYNSVGFCDELSHVFLGLDLSEVPRDTQGLEEEHMTIERVALADVPAMIADGRLLDAKTIIGLTLARAALSTG